MKSRRFRRATPDDAPGLARVHIDAWRSAYRGLVPDGTLDGLDYDRRSTRFRESLSTEAEETYVVEEGEEVLGFLTIGACRDLDVDEKSTGEIWGIYLAPGHWRKGIGTFLARHGMRLLKSRGYTIAVLWVFEGNGQARRFYEAMGFETDGATKLLNLGIPLKAIRYRRTLEPADPGNPANP